MSGIKKVSFARLFDTLDSIGSVVPIEMFHRLSFAPGKNFSKNFSGFEWIALGRSYW
nr:hypothetical protein [uncultured Agathobaculum sp.]